MTHPLATGSGLGQPLSAQRPRVDPIGAYIRSFKAAHPRKVNR